MIDFIKNGSKLDGILFSMKEEDILRQKGKPDQMIGDDIRKYYYYGNYRYGINNFGIVDELTLEFNDPKLKYKFNTLTSFHQGIEMTETFIISSITNINKFIYFLNFLQVEWTCHEKKSLDYFTIDIINGPNVLFNLHNGKNFKITKIKIM